MANRRTPGPRPRERALRGSEARGGCGVGRRRLVVLTGLAVVLAAVPRPAAAQVGVAEVGAFNIAGGALVGGIAQALRGGSFLDGLQRGAEAGAVVFAGKLVASRAGGSYAQAAGRLVGQAGASMLRNAMEDRARFARLTFMVGPVVVDVGDDFRVRPDVGTIDQVMQRALDGDYAFDLGYSLRFLAPVFVRTAGGPRNEVASTNRGTLTLGAGAQRGGHAWEAVYAHEAVHLIQQDLNAIAVVQPLLDRTLGDPAVTWNTGNRVLRPFEYLTCGTQCWTETEAHTLGGNGAWSPATYGASSIRDAL